MKFTHWFSSLLRKIPGRTWWSKLKGLASAPFRGGIAALLAAWRERRRVSLPEDRSHYFLVRSYPGSRMRRYRVHLPRGSANSQPRPLVVVLHGCRQDHLDIENITGFNQLSDRHDFLVAYPFVTSYRGLRNKNCWGWWFEREIHAGAGEVEDLWQIIEEIKRDYAVDERRIHVTGLSSGGGMAVAMMVAHAGKIASGASVAGLPYAERAEAVHHGFNPRPVSRPVEAIVAAMRSEMGAQQRPPPIQVIHSKDDDKVRLQSAELIRDSWGQCCDIDTHRPSAGNHGDHGSSQWELLQYRDSDGNSVIETLFLEGPGHGWYGGNPGNFSFTDAPDIKQGIWKFFQEHPLPG